jgi:PKD repeat protein
MKKILFTITLVIFGFGLFAAPVLQETAQQVAVNFYKHYAVTATDYTIADIATGQRDGMTTYYVFIFKAGGFVMVSADDAIIPVLGFSANETFDKNNLPLNAQNWFNDYNKQIKSIVDAKVDNIATAKEWKKIQNNQFSDEKGINTVNPLLGTIAWDQTGNWDLSCPSHYPAGCVATATGQVMKKWAYPATGVGSHSYYSTATSTMVTVNYGTSTYNWSSMSNTSATSGSETLLYQIGVSVDMQYASAGSGAQQSDIPRALIENFNYQPTAEMQTMSNFTNAAWIALLENELNAGRPILYAGVDASAGDGHSFVFDGWSGSNLFHVNWGWSGTDNGNFAIGSLNPSGQGTYNSDNQAVIRVQPKSATVPIANFTANNAFIPTGGSVNFTDLSTNSPTTWSWSFTGGTPATSTSQAPGAITYSTAGRYLVSLTVSNSSGSDIKTVSKMITVGGTSPGWVPQDLGYPKSNLYYNRMVSGISVCSPKVAWATIIDAGASYHYINEFALTKDGGNTWKPDTITFTNSGNYCIANISPIDSLTAYAAMYPIMNTLGGIIAKTTDGGKTWSTTGSPSFTKTWLDFVHFFDASYGVCVGDATSSSASKFVIYTTSNGGSSWTAVSLAATTLLGGIESSFTNDFSAIGDTMWFGTSQGRVCKSINKGASWTGYATSFTNYDSLEITPVFRNLNVGFVTGINPTSYAFKGVEKTTNGGTSYAAVTPNGYYVKNPDFAYIPGTTSSWVDVTGGWGSGSGLSSNDCSNFANIDTGSVTYTCAKFYDLNNGWAGSIVSPTNGGIWKWNPALITDVDNSIQVKPEQINVYPNPANNIVNILFSGISAKSKVNVYNLVGEKILSEEVNPSFNNLLQLDMSTCNSGIYFVTVDTGTKIISKRIMLVK